MISAWTIGINIIARSNAGGVFSKMGGQANAANAKVDKLKGGIKGIPAAVNMTKIALDGLAITLAATFAVGIKGAADLQDQLNRLSITLGQTPDAVDKKFMPIAVKYGTTYGTNLVETTKEEIALSKIFKTQKQINAVRPTAYKFANVMATGSDMDREEAMKTFGQVSHMLGAYDAKSSAAIGESLSKKVFASPDKLQEMVKQLAYFGEMWSRAGVKPEKILQATIFGALTLPGKYGPAYDQLYKNILVPTAPMAAGQVALGIRAPGTSSTGPDVVKDYMRNGRHYHRTTHGKTKTHAGKLVDGIFDKEGHFDPMEFFTILEKKSRGMTPEQSNALFYSAFNVRAVRSAITGANPKALAYNIALGKAISHEPGLDEQNRRLMVSLNKQTERLKNNFESMATLLAKPFLKDFTSAMTKLADVLGSITRSLQAHPEQAKAAGGAMIAGGAWGLWRIAAFARIAVHAFTKGMGVSLFTAGHKEMEHFEKSMTKALGNAIAGIGKNIATVFSSKFILPLLTQVNKLGPIGSNIVGWVLKIGTSIGTLGGFLGTLGSILGKLAGAPLTALMMVLNPNTISDKHSKDGGIGETDADLTRVRGIDAKRRASYLRLHQPTASAPNPQLKHRQQAMVAVPRPQNGHGQQASIVINHNFHAGKGTSDATNRLQAIAQGREVAKQVAAVMSQYGRTATRAAGQTIASARMSSFETTSSYS